MKWDEWRYNHDRTKPVFYIKHLLNIFGCRVNIHKMVGEDSPMCFHSHPAHAIRIVLWGGYCDEQIEEGTDHDTYTFRDRRIFSVGIVRPDFAHRIHELLNGKTSYSLWIRFRKTAEIKLVGRGWKKIDT